MKVILIYTFKENNPQLFGKYSLNLLKISIDMNSTAEKNKRKDIQNIPEIRT